MQVFPKNYWTSLCIDVLRACNLTQLQLAVTEPFIAMKIRTCLSFKAIYLKNREALIVLCSVVKHAGSG